MHKKQLVCIERLEIMEDKFGVTFEGLNAEIDQDESILTLNVYGEMHPTNGTSIKQDLAITVTAFDSEGKIIAITETTVYEEKFFALENFHMQIYDITSKPVKIRVYPKADV